MALSRRDFLKLCAGGAAAISMSGVLAPFLKEAVAATGNPPVIWLQGASCTGCSVSLLNTVHPDIKEVLLNVISLKYHSNISAAAGDLAIDTIRQTAKDSKGEFFLVIEGAVPVDADGLYCTIGEEPGGHHLTFVSLLKELSKDARAILNVGTCSAFGGIPAAGKNPTGCKAVGDVISGVPMINIPGCPSHPDWIVGTLAHVVLYNAYPEMDDFGRPTMFFNGIVHDNCPRRQYFDNGIFAENFSDPGCLLLIGCRGPYTHCDSLTRKWNGGVNSCIIGGGPCLGCTEKNFPNGPVYKRLPDFVLGPRINVKADTLGKVLAGFTAVGIGAHLVANVVTGRLSSHPEEKEKEGDN